MPVPLFPVADEFERSRLDTARTQSSGDLSPKQRADEIADKSVEDSPRLLRVNETQIDRTRIFHSFLDCLLCDFIEYDTARRSFFDAEQIRQVP